MGQHMTALSPWHREFPGLMLDKTRQDKKSSVFAGGGGCSRQIGGLPGRALVEAGVVCQWIGVYFLYEWP